MDYSNLEFTKLKKVVRLSLENRRSTLYKDSKKYYKLWNTDSKLGPYFILNKFNLLAQGNDNLVGKKLNLINEKTCCAFDDLIFYNDYCCGYSIFIGTKLSTIKTTSKDYIDYYKKYVSFIDVLVEVSLSIGYFIPDVGLHNVIEFNNSLSLIDLDFVPVSISGYKKLSNKEQNHIDRYILTGNYRLLSKDLPFFSRKESMYLNSMKEKIF